MDVNVCGSTEGEVGRLFVIGKTIWQEQLFELVPDRLYW